MDQRAIEKPLETFGAGGMHFRTMKPRPQGMEGNGVVITEDVETRSEVRERENAPSSAFTSGASKVWGSTCDAGLTC